MIRTPSMVAGVALCVSVAVGLTAAAAAQGRGIPEETAAYRPSGLPGYTLVQRHCVTCHSAQYVSTQPPASSRAYWEATVKKMQKPFGAIFPDEDIAAMVDYLSRTYGAEQPQQRTGRAAAAGG
jgi:sulfite dehydrogenase